MNYINSYKDGKSERKHRIVAEKMLGRKLKKDEVVHHIDGNKRNNDESNLMIVTRSEHAKLHSFGKEKRKAVVQMDRYGNTIKIWESARLASMSLKLYPGNISKCCKGELKTTGGFGWKFLENA